MKRRDFLIAGGALAASLALPARAAFPDKPVRYIIAVRPGRRVRHRGALPAVGVPAQEVRPGAGDRIQARRGRRARLVAAQHVARRRLHDDGHEPAAHRAAAARRQRPVQDRRHHHRPLLPLHARRASSCATSRPFKTYQDLVAAAKASPGKLNFAGSGHQLGQPRRPRAPEQRRGHQDHVRRVQGHRRPGRLAAGRARRRRDVVLVARARAEGQDAPARGGHREAPDLLPRHAHLPGARHRLGRRRLSAASACPSRRPRTCASASPTCSPRSTATRSSASRCSTADSRSSTSPTTRWPRSWRSARRRYIGRGEADGAGRSERCCTASLRPGSMLT